MKKILILFALLIGISVPMSANVILGEQISAADIKDGSLIAIQTSMVNFSDMIDWEGWYLSDNVACTKTFSPVTVWRVKSAPVGEDGTARFYLINYSTDQYVGDITDASRRFKMVSIDSARTFYFRDYTGEDGTMHNTNGKGVEALSESPASTASWYIQSLTIGGESLNTVEAYFNPISSSNNIGDPLLIFSVTEEQDYAADLQTQVEVITNSGEEYPAGTDPGYFDEASVSAYESALMKAINMLAAAQATDQEYIDAKNELVDAWNAVRGASAPVTEGYYYIVSTMEDFLNVQNVEMGMTANDTIAIWRALDTDSPDFVWQLTANGDNFDVYNLGLGSYLHHPTGEWYTSGGTAQVSKEAITQQKFEFIGAGQWHITSNWLDDYWAGTYNYNYCIDNANSGSNTEGHITTTMRDGLYQRNSWYLRRISDDMLQNIGEIIAANTRLKTMQGLIDDANALVDKTLLYKTTGNGLITTAGNGVEGNQITFSTIRTQGIEGADDYKFLIDNLDSTYMQGAGTISVNISATPTDKVAITYRTRGATVERPSAGQWGLDERPANVVLYASKSTGDDSVWVKIDSTNMATLGVPAQWYVDMKDTYSYLRLVVKNNATNGNYFTLGEFQIYNYEPDQDNSQYYSVSGMKDAVDALQIQIDSAKSAVGAKSVSEAQINDMQSAIAAVRTLYSDTTSLKELIAEAQALATTATVGDQIGDLTDTSAATTLQSAITAAQDESLYTTPLNKTGIDQASATLNNAMAAFRAAIRMPDTSKWYYIRSLTSITNRSGEAGAADAQCYGAVLYTRGNNASSNLSWGYVDESGEMTNIYSPSTMWRIVPIEGTGNYAIQNLGSGLYVGELGNQSEIIRQSETPQPYSITALGNRQFAFISQSAANTRSRALYCGGKATNILITAPSVDGDGAWGFTEVDLSQIDGISISEFANNLMDVMTLPYNVENISDFNDDVHTYGIRKITQQENAEGQLVSTIELYEKTSVRAGEPVIIILGDTAQNVPCEDFDLFLPFPTEVTSTPVAANGLTGVLSEAKCAKGTGISTAKVFIPMGSDAVVPSHTGVIDPSKYTGEITGVETAYTLTAVGLNPLPTGSKADVNGDGEINSADIAVVYNYIANGEGSGYTKDAVDVNGDGEVNSSDVANIYAQIAGGDAASKAFAQKILKLLQAK